MAAVAAMMVQLSVVRYSIGQTQVAGGGGISGDFGGFDGCSHFDWRVSDWPLFCAEKAAGR